MGHGSGKSQEQLEISTEQIGRAAGQLPGQGCRAWRCRDGHTGQCEEFLVATPHPKCSEGSRHGQGRRNTGGQSTPSTCSGCAWIQSALSASHLEKKPPLTHFLPSKALSFPSELIHGSGSGTAAGLPSPPQLSEAQSNTIGMMAGPAVGNLCRTPNS